MINTTLSCTPPIVQLAGKAALERDTTERDLVMQKFRKKVELLTSGLNRIEGFRSLDPAATFYVFPNVAPICNRLKITSHGLALYLLEGADDDFGVACLGGECFGEAALTKDETIAMRGSGTWSEASVESGAMVP